MPDSKRFRRLAKREQKLRDTFLPKRFSTTGEYRISQRDQAKAYRLLMHAEIESYLEDIAEHISRAAHSRWKARRHISRPLLGLVSSVVGEMKGARKINNQTFLDWFINSAFEKQISRIRKNNGIKEVDVAQLLLSLGLLDTDLDSALLANMNSFGKLRGDTAHQSAHGRITQEVDPKTEANAVAEIIKGLKNLDRTLFGLLER